MSYLMIIDDDEDFATAVAKLLSDAGHEVTIALEIQGGVDKMLERRPDLVVLDVMFPENGTAGFDLARAMRRKYEQFRDIPVLMLTAINAKSPVGFSSTDIDEDWLPVTDFLEKPVDMDVLLERVSTLLAKQAQLRP
jgi:DNA-binding response OmpR family regulator